MNTIATKLWAEIEAKEVQLRLRLLENDPECDWSACKALLQHKSRTTSQSYMEVLDKALEEAMQGFKING